MSVQKGTPEMSIERCYTDVALRSSWMQDAQATANILREQNLHAPAPGSSKIDFPGHIHRNNGDGRGILRLCDGGFYIADASTGYINLTLTGAAGPTSIGSVYTSDYQVDPDAGSSYFLGMAYVSPGVESIKVEFQAWSNSLGAGAIRFVNRKDVTFSPYQWLSVTPTWYSLAVEVTPMGSGRIARVPLDVEGVSTSTVNVRLAAAFPFEYQDAPTP